jgi:hypothetical protein
VQPALPLSFNPAPATPLAAPSTVRAMHCSCYNCSGDANRARLVSVLLCRVHLPLNKGQACVLTAPCTGLQPLHARDHSCTCAIFGFMASQQPQDGCAVHVAASSFIMTTWGLCCTAAAALYVHAVLCGLEVFASCVTNQSMVHCISIH